MTNTRKVRSVGAVPLTHKTLRAAKRQFKKQPHSTRPFTSADYAALPKGDNQ